MFKFGIGDAVSLPAKVVQLASGKNLTNFEDGMFVHQDDDGATGYIDDINYAANQLIISGTTGAWSPSTNNYVVGPEVTDPNAPDPSGVNFLGSTFASSDGSLDPGSADWQVTTLADTGYSSIVSEVEKHPDMTDPQPKWISGALEGETEYRARTKYYAASGEESPWSDDITFKTGIGTKDTQTTPGAIYVVGPNNLTPVRKAKDDILFVSTCSNNSRFYGIGIDGAIYQSNIGDIANSSFSKYTGSSDYANIYSVYNQGGSDPTSGKLNQLVTVKNNGTVECWDASGNLITQTEDLKGCRVFLSWYTNTYLFLTPEHDALYAFNIRQVSGGTYLNGTIVQIHAAAKDVGLPELPADVTIREIIAAVVDQRIYFLGDDDVLYVWENASDKWQESTRKVVTTDVAKIARCNFYGPTYACLGILKNDGTIWYIVEPEGPDPFRPNLTTPQPLTQIDVGSGRKYISPPFAPYLNKAWFAIGEDGNYWGGYQSSTSVSMIGVPTNGKLANTGDFYNGQTSNSSSPAVLIVPE